MDDLRERCPWDKKQTRQTLKPYLIEECYELVEAIEEGDASKIKEELGDLLFQIVFHCRIASERGEFDMSGVIGDIGEKMKNRHPHVFGEKKLSTAEEVSLHWEERKRAEGKLRESILEGVPRTMPSLLRARRLQDRAAKTGFDWENAADALLKLDEEVLEFREALKGGNKDEIEDELGDVLFMLVNVSRFAAVNPEDALGKTIGKFISRFSYMEGKAAGAGLRLKDMTLKEMDALWDEAKGKRPPKP